MTVWNRSLALATTDAGGQPGSDIRRCRERADVLEVRTPWQLVIDHMFYICLVACRDQRPANVAYYRRNRESEIARVQVRQRGTVELLRELRERPCMDCGGSFEPHQMDFDHRDGATKSFRLTSGDALLRPTAVILDEAAKCDVVSANCHRIRTWQRHRVRPPAAPGASRYLDRKRTNWRRQATILDRCRAVPCSDCGERYPPCAMDFDHRDPSTKRAAVTRMIGRAGTQRLLDEIAKCDIVCANCHRLRTLRRRSAATARE
jgi:hypothetical protein